MRFCCFPAAPVHELPTAGLETNKLQPARRSHVRIDACYKRGTITVSVICSAWTSSPKYELLYPTGQLLIQ